MNDTNKKIINSVEFEQTGKNTVLVVYALYIVGIFFIPVIGSLVGLIIAYVKQNEYEGTIYYSHFNNQIKIFWYSFLLYTISGLLCFVLLGFLLLPLVVIWHLYQIIIGIINITDKKERYFSFF